LAGQVSASISLASRSNFSKIVSVSSEPNVGKIDLGGASFEINTETDSENCFIGGNTTKGSFVIGQNDDIHIQRNSGGSTAGIDLTTEELYFGTSGLHTRITLFSIWLQGKQYQRYPIQICDENNNLKTIYVLADDSSL
jgi:hypothetical protein